MKVPRYVFNIKTVNQVPLISLDNLYDMLVSLKPVARVL